MPPVPPQRGGAQAPSVTQKLAMGAMMGGSVGVIIGFIFGTTTIFRYGAGPNGIMRTLGQYMAASGATFGFFMAIGSVIRTDAHPVAQEIYMRSQMRPMIIARQAFRRPDQASSQ
ncbi:hypothetical protein SAPIO_CDS10043 [Scedosporium apiospermum]|uniref:Mitochondrial genome maintenance protein Mgr2 n=1 Tax=Pseudallescheria apiosperma TaxID=563466 RepID=A0A084FW88_PSEDA|nr:uncharacterized protein SAPIO_CDS10043 [Scedosporium apiospermum]KEZ39350.1 hypothetical protein SAPIO_CDS10043 [Scedosporium apiospermum]